MPTGSSSCVAIAVDEAQMSMRLEMDRIAARQVFEHIDYFGERCWRESPMTDAVVQLRGGDPRTVRDRSGVSTANLTAESRGAGTQQYGF